MSRAPEGFKPIGLTAEKLDAVRVLLDTLMASGGEISDVARSLAAQLGLELTPPALDLNEPLCLLVHGERWRVRAESFDIRSEPVFGYLGNRDGRTITITLIGHREPMTPEPPGALMDGATWINNPDDEE